MINILTPTQLQNYPQSIVELFQGLEEFVITDIARRLKKTGQITSTAEWQKNQAELYNIKNVELKIAKVLNLSLEQIDSLFPDIAEASLDQEANIYKKAGYKPITLKESQALKDYLKAAIKNTRGDIENITQSLGFAEIQNGKVAYNSIAKFYQKELNLANVKIISGTQDYNTAIKQAVRKIAESGIRTVNYESGYSINIDSAARRAVLTSVHQMSQEMSNYNLEKLIPNKDDRYVEVTSHFPCRPSHLKFQGRVFKVVGSDENYPNLEESTGLGTATGLKGINCRHDYFPFIPNVSVRIYTDEQLKDMEKKSEETFNYKDESYTPYEATQYQRALENEIRKLKRENLMYKETGLDKDAKATNSQINALRREYKNFSEVAGISEKKNRLTI